MPYVIDNLIGTYNTRDYFQYSGRNMDQKSLQRKIHRGAAILGKE